MQLKTLLNPFIHQWEIKDSFNKQTIENVYF